MKPENGFLSRCLLLIALLLLPGSAIAQTPAQQIVDDAAASKLLWREPRKKWDII